MIKSKLRKDRYILLKSNMRERVFVMKSELNGFDNGHYEFHYHFNYKDRYERGNIYPQTRIVKKAHKLR